VAAAELLGMHRQWFRLVERDAVFPSAANEDSSLPPAKAAAPKPPNNRIVVRSLCHVAVDSASNESVKHSA
jgi:hypothetical protein